MSSFGRIPSGFQDSMAAMATLQSFQMPDAASPAAAGVWHHPATPGTPPRPAGRSPSQAGQLASSAAAHPGPPSFIAAHAPGGGRTQSALGDVLSYRAAVQAQQLQQRWDGAAGSSPGVVGPGSPGVRVRHARASTGTMGDVSAAGEQAFRSVLVRVLHAGRAAWASRPAKARKAR